MTESVLVPLDGTDLSEQVLPLARMVGRKSGARIHLVSVEEFGSDFGDRGEYLEKIARGLRAEDVEADYAVPARQYRRDDRGAGRAGERRPDRDGHTR